MSDNKRTSAVLAVDIGYANVKLVTAPFISTSDQPSQFLFPSFAGSVTEHSALSILTHADIFKVKPKPQKGATTVGEYVVGIDVATNLKADEFSRDLTADFTQSDTYTALFYGALLYARKRGNLGRTVNQLVLGLPVDSWLNEDRRAKMKEYAMGNHRISNDLDIEIENVIVVPQPYGTYAHLMEESWQTENVMIVDQGEHTMDVLTLKPNAEGHPAINPKRSFSRQNSGRHAFLSAMLQKIASNQKVQLPAGRLRDLDDALRGKSVFKAFGNIVDLVAIAKEPSVLRTLTDALGQLEDAMGDVSDLDRVIVTGGAPEALIAAMKERPSFRNFKIETPSQSVFSNALGFYQLGVNAATN